MAKGYRPEEGGMQTYAEGVAQAYAAAGAAVTVFTQTSAGPRRARSGSVTLVDIGPGGSVFVPLRLLRAMRRERHQSGAPWFTHGTTWRTSALPMILGLPYITTFHGREFMYAGGLVLRVMRRVAKRAQGCVAVSHYSAARLSERLGPDAGAAVVAWNGPSLWPAGNTPGPSEHEERETPRIFSLCRLEPRKNMIASVRACAVMRERGYRFRYVIGGRGPDLPGVHEAVERHRLGDVVEVAGFIPADRAARLYADADIFLHPQVAGDKGRDFEGFGIAIADAMFAASAVIVGRQGGAKELVEDGKSGLVVDGHSQSSIEAALEALLAEPEKRMAMAAAARCRARDNFSWLRHIAIILARIDPGACSPRDASSSRSAAKDLPGP